jgi:hypothetical protein
MPRVKFWGNRMVTGIINWVCGGTKFTDVSCGFRAFNREAAYRLTLFGRFTYTQECFIDLFSKGLRIVEVPLKIRGVREHGSSRMASSIWRYAISSLPIIVRAMRDIQPLKFFGGIGLGLFLPGLFMLMFVSGWYLWTGATRPRGPVTSPFTSLISIGGVLMTLGFLLGVLALLADMLGRTRRINEELLYLARRKIFATRRTVRVTMPAEQANDQPAHPVAPGLAALHDSWAMPVMRTTDDEAVDADEPPVAVEPVPRRDKPRSREAV